MLSAKTDVYSSKQQQNTLPSPPTHQHTMTMEQQKYCTAIIRNLKRHRDAAPFLKPVDYIKLNVPDYPTIITQPMDLELVEKKLGGSEYTTVDDFISDVRLIFHNCFKYNGPEAMISVLCQNVESAFEKSLRQMPPSSAPSTPKSSTPKASSPVKKEPSPPLSQHNSPPPLASKVSEESTRPKREIHCPSKDYPETFTTQKKISNNSPMKYCLQTLKELKKAKYRQLAYPFLEPVDPVAMNLPDYTTIVKRPMDLSTIEKKLMNDEYDDPEGFESDMTLMFNNCYLYNPPTLPIYTMAKDLEKVFRDKWAQKPAEHRKMAQKRPSQSQPSGSQKRHSIDVDHDDDEEEEDEVDNSDDKIAELERTIKNIAEQIKSIKSSKKGSSSSTAIPAPKRRGRGPNKNPTKKRRAEEAAAAARHADSGDEYEVFTFQDKKKLSEQINELTGDALSTVVEIIQASMPHLGDGDQGEIVLDIDALNKDTLRKLRDFVSPKSTIKTKKRKSNYSAKERRIQELEKTLEKFNQADPNYHSSSSESDSGDDDGGSSSDSSSSDSD
ncbi:Bromodomain-containing protein [Mucor lusitanicus]|uniref:Bromodomain-containing protein n=3 Tax=Mucor circinelloides f. lusitanicus TaxID=29924 RepID=A0A8H4BEK2_MUCCL|nr:Bromodomain-containing protein [Mucor lusitanicus]